MFFQKAMPQLIAPPLPMGRVPVLADSVRRS
ncbi:hypothetical protein OKW18_006577 [Streptomyces pratensis]|nr:hypothetical protein [Streptomyces pratensis]